MSDDGPAGISAVPGLRVGHATDPGAATGCTVVLGPFRAACDVRGLATGTREVEALSPLHVVERADAILLTGGSAFGLAAADGVMGWLEENGAGFDVGVARVPIVPAAVIFDLATGRADRRPDAAMGRAACEAAARGEPDRSGRLGAGTGATVGKLRGPEAADAGGLGSRAVKGSDWTMGALAVVNAFGDVLDHDGRIAAGARRDDGGFLDSDHALRQGALAGTFAELAGRARAGTSTTLVVVATDAPLSRDGLVGIARAAATGVARRIRPVHTLFDGDVTFAVSTAPEPRPLPPAAHLALGALAAHVVEQAITAAVARPGRPDGAATRDSISR